VNAEKAGSLKTLGKEGDTLKIGDVLAKIDESAVKPAAKPEATNGTPAQAKQEKAKAAPEKKAAVPEPVKESPVSSSDVKATPVAAAIITDKKVDKGTIVPS